MQRIGKGVDRDGEGACRETEGVWGGVRGGDVAAEEVEEGEEGGGDGDETDAGVAVLAVGEWRVEDGGDSGGGRGV